MTDKQIVEKYFDQLRKIRNTGAGTPETAYYNPLGELLGEIGKRLKPHVTCVMGLRDQGEGMPDGGLFSADQVRGKKGKEPFEGAPPSRGVIEAKPLSAVLGKIAEGEQVSRYWERYRKVLVTNFREFVFLGEDERGECVSLEGYTFAKSDDEFWKRIEHPKKFAEETAEGAVEYLTRVLLLAVPLNNPKDLAWFLASYAREARYRLEHGEAPPLNTIKTALEDSLGIKFSATKKDHKKGEHFFLSTLVQTLFYGLFSGWVLWTKEQERARKKAVFQYSDTAKHIRVPVLRKLFHELIEPGRLDDLHLTELMEWATGALNRVNRLEFFSKFVEEHAVQYFYEPFLEAFDPELRKELGVWYTPREIVQYMVERVDRVLRNELNIADGLADPNVYVLDPCCGTGAFLVEVLRSIHGTLRNKGVDALVGEDLRRAATERVFGFELLPAPFVVSHLQLGLLMQHLGAPLAEKGSERLGVYLTNALAGWEPPKAPKSHLPFQEFEDERDAAERIKREKPILVIIGNPPYNAYAGVSSTEEEGLVDVYKVGLQTEWKIKKFNLDDLYVRFFRLAERRIAEKTGKGVVCFISNFSYLKEPSFVVMRRMLAQNFSSLEFDSLNGDSRETGKLTPEGEPDPSVFSTNYNREGIQKGTAIATLIRKPSGNGVKSVDYRDFWGKDKRDDLLQSLKAKGERRYVKVALRMETKYSFRPFDVDEEYWEWPEIPDLAAISPFNGPVERRGFALIALDRETLARRIKAYFDPAMTDEEIKEMHPSLMMDGNRIVGKVARKKLLGEHTFSASNIVRYPFKPFDYRWCYLANIRPLFSEPSPVLIEQQKIDGNAFLITRDTADKRPEGAPFYYSPRICDYDAVSGHARHFPILVEKRYPKRRNSAERQVEFEGFEKPKAQVVPNISNEAIQYLDRVGPRPTDLSKSSQDLWSHILAIGFSPSYLRENADGIREGWPRVPLPRTLTNLLASAKIGCRIRQLLDMENPVPTISTGDVGSEYRLFGVVNKVAGGELNLQRGDLAITSGWGHAGKDGVTMPGKGKIAKRSYHEDESESLNASAERLGLSRARIIGLLGEDTYDVFLNDNAYWKNIPANVWGYYIGGYQVIKKWLSYREEELIKRSLTVEEAREVTEMVRRIAAIILLGPELDENYQRVKADSFRWTKE